MIEIWKKVALKYWQNNVRPRINVLTTMGKSQKPKTFDQQKSSISHTVGLGHIFRARLRVGLGWVMGMS